MAGSSVSASTTFDSASFTWTLNGPGYFEADIPWDAFDRATWLPGAREVRLRRDGTRVWGGYMTRLSVAVTAEEPRPRFNVSGHGYFERLRRYRVTSDLIYTDDPQEDIAAALVAHAMSQANGDIGLTAGSHTGSSRTRDREYCAIELPNVGEAIEEFATLEDGIDFEVDELKAFNTWAPHRGSTSVVHTFDGDDEITLDLEEDASEAASYASAIGNPPDDCAPRIVTVSDATAISRFKRLHEVTDADTNQKAEVTEEATELLRQRSKGFADMTLTYDVDYGPAWGAIELGDMVGVDIPLGAGVFDEELRVMALRLSLEHADSAYLELSLDGAAIS